MKTLITGCSGLVGSALVESLFAKGHSIQCLQRNHNSPGGLFWATSEIQNTPGKSFDFVVHLAGENVATGRWSESKKQAILESRVIGTRELVDYISLLEHKPRVFLCASAVGYYGSRGDEIVSEKASLGDSFLAEVCRQWEKESQRLTALGVRVVNLRFGMVLSPNGGALQKMVPPFKAGLGGVVGSGEQYIGWISIRDLVEIVSFCMANEQIRGPVNVVSPIATTNKELTKLLGKILHRPTLFKVPAFVVRTLFGQMADEMLLASTRATPQVLLESGYQFLDQSLETVLTSCLNEKKDVKKQ